jgi:hypothetical protein
MRHAAIALVAACCLSVVGHTQTADELIDKNIAAKGGIEKMKALKTLRVQGRFDGGGGFTAMVTQENMRPNLYRSTFALQGMTQVEAYDGATAWQIQPFGGHKDPELVGEDGMHNVLISADFDGPLVDYKAKGNTVEYLGHDVVDGDDALRLKVTLKNGDVMYYYLDPDTFLEIRRETEYHIRGSVRATVEDLGSYKPVNGVMFPFSVATGPRNSSDRSTITLTKVEANGAMDSAEFALPASLAAKKPAGGQWPVRVP